jgi:two-component system phosphate regulon sensor histidine kinase PhoR
LASHQLRTPITSINWFLKLLSSNKHGELNAKQKDFLNEILAASEQMSELVEDLLDVSRLDKNEGFIEPEHIALLPLLEEVVRNNKSLIEKKDIHFEYLILCSTDIEVRADGEKVKTVIDNILNNAIKYSHTGGDVTLKLDCGDENVVVEIQDKGIGVPEKDRELIFNRFTRAENASESGEQGTGLGLYLSQKIIKKHGGSLTLDSVEGEGTQVKIILPRNTN